MKRTGILVTVLVGASLLGACSGDGGMADAVTSTSTTTTTSGASRPATVENFAFSPKQMTVRAGERVTWTNKDAFRHTVTSGAVDGPVNVPDGRFDVTLDTNATGDVIFERPGTFTYYCKQHNAMNGTVTVTA